MPDTEKTCCDSCGSKSNDPHQQVAEESSTQPFDKTKLKYLIGSLLIVIPFEILSFFSIHLPQWIEFPFFAAITLFIGRNVLTSGAKSLAKLRFSDINLLMSIAVVGAFYLGQYEEAAIIVILFALANALEEYGIQKSQSALEALVRQTPKTAQVKGENDRTPIEQIKIGQVIIVKPGDVIPIDGIVNHGDSLVSESSITGEPLPKTKQKGDAVYAGTANGNGYLEIKTTKTSKDSALAKIIELTYKSAEEKTHSQKFIEKFAQYYTPLVMLFAILLVAIPVGLLRQPFVPWFTQALTILVIACPCALVISTPVSVFSALGNANKKGILIKGGRFLEEMGNVKAIAFDKTRTLTVGEPRVSDIITFNGYSRNEVLSCIAGIETYSEHPLAKSIIEKAKESQLPIHQFSAFKAIPGKGLTGTCLVCSDAHHCVGSINFIEKEHRVENEIRKQVEAFEKQGKTVVIASNGTKVKGIIAIEDQVRPESKLTVEDLSKQGIASIMLTGDNKAAAEYVASQVGIKQVHAALLPEDKVEKISSLSKQYGVVAMVGDGVNDAPALASANVGIAMGAVGSDAAIENADIALMNDKIQGIPYLARLGKRTVQTIRLNVGMALLTKLVFLGLALIGLGNLAIAIFADVGITLIVVLNSLRLLQFEA